MTIEQAQAKRKHGYWMITNKAMTKVIEVSKSEKEAREIYAKTDKHGLPVYKLFSPLRKETMKASEIKSWMAFPSAYFDTDSEL